EGTQIEGEPRVPVELTVRIGRAVNRALEAKRADHIEHQGQPAAGTDDGQVPGKRAHGAGFDSQAAMVSRNDGVRGIRFKDIDRIIAKIAAVFPIGEDRGDLRIAAEAPALESDAGSKSSAAIRRENAAATKAGNGLALDRKRRLDHRPRRPLRDDWLRR